MIPETADDARTPRPTKSVSSRGARNERRRLAVGAIAFLAPEISLSDLLQTLIASGEPLAIRDERAEQCDWSRDEQREAVRLAIPGAWCRSSFTSQP
jgi:hypothetical protein